MKFVLSLVAAFALASPAVAQHGHGDLKGPSGGPMLDVAGVHAELLIAGTTITLNIFDEGNKPVLTKGFSGSALIVAGAERETVTLTPTTENALKAETKKPISPSAAITVTLKTSSKSGQVRFKR